MKLCELCNCPLTALKGEKRKMCARCAPETTAAPKPRPPPKKKKSGDEEKWARVSKIFKGRLQ